ncbi:MAG: Npun_R1517 family heterocyst differentiation transcriptional regulator [Leptolyngbyaceae cyanobacterium bins.302]|nr:Npun_R1517 family heterocyst differentiation transcriptional regulator [Leptolyngbyaceae cyanobacterium bins.302]
MQYESLEHQRTSTLEIGVYECEVHLKFRLIEEKGTLSEHGSLLEILMDAFAYGADEYLESIQVEATAQEISELQASPQLRRQLIRLRNSSEL